MIFSADDIQGLPSLNFVENRDDLERYVGSVRNLQPIAILRCYFYATAAQFQIAMLKDIQTKVTSSRVIR